MKFTPIFLFPPWIFMALSIPGLADTPLKPGTSVCQFGDCGLQSMDSASDTESPTPNQPVSTNHRNASGDARKMQKDSIRHTQAAERSTAGETDATLSNLPRAYAHASWADFKASEHSVEITAQPGLKLRGVRTGDVLEATLEDEIEVWPGVNAGVRAFVTRGPYQGAIVSGVATLDPSRKKILIAFDKLRLKSPVDASYSLKAAVRTTGGRWGLDGNYHSEGAKFVIGEVAAATAAGFADATVSRSQTSYGAYIEEPSISNSAKSGAVTALSHRADRFVQQEAQAPEWTELDGYHEVQIFIQSDPTEDTN